MSIPSRVRASFPNFLLLLFFVEMWERFSYYGMRALLVLYLTSKLGFADQKAYAIYSLFAALSYTSPVICGFIADKLTGFRFAVILGSLVISIGHLILAFQDADPYKMYLGLSFVAIGTGWFKGNVSNLLGQCYSVDDPRRTQGFTLFYVAVNVGSFSAALSCGYVAKTYGWDYGFGLAGIGMVIGGLIFMLFQNVLGDVGLSPQPKLMSRKLLGIRPDVLGLALSAVVAIAASKAIAHHEIFASFLQYFGIVALGVFVYIVFKVEAMERKNLVTIAVLICFLMLFFALEMQLGSLINLFVERNVDKVVFGMSIPASWSQSINPFSIIIVGFIFSSMINLDPKYDLARVFLALLAMGGCFFMLYLGCLSANDEHQVPYIYLFVGISLMGFGEVLIAPVVFSQLTLYAPKRIQGFLMGFMMLSLAFSNLAGIIISKFMSVPSVGGIVDRAESLAIYKEGFSEIAIFNLILALAFVPIGYLVKRR